MPTKHLTREDFQEYFRPFAMPPVPIFIRSMITHVRYLDDELIAELGEKICASPMWRELCNEVLALCDDALKAARVIAPALQTHVSTIPIGRYLGDDRTVTVFVNSMVRKGASLHLSEQLPYPSQLLDMLFVRCNAATEAVEICGAKPGDTNLGPFLRLPKMGLSSYAPPGEALVPSSLILMRPSQVQAIE